MFQNGQCSSLMTSPKVVFLPLSEIANNLKQLIKPSRHGFLKSFDECFSSKEAISIVLSQNYAVSISDSIKLLNKLLEKGYFKCVDPKDGRFSEESALFRFQVIFFFGVVLFYDGSTEIIIDFFFFF
jgi:hypothetical protein